MVARQINPAWYVQQHEERGYLRRLYWYSFLLRCSCGLTGWVLMLLADIPLLQDAVYYEQVGSTIAEDWLNGRQSTWLELHAHEPHQPVLMVTVIGCFYVLTLGIRALPLLLILYCGITAYTPAFTYRIAKQLGASPSGARSSGWLVAVCPAFVFWSGALYKEGLVLLALNVAVYHTIKLQGFWNRRSLAMLCLTLFALVGLRLYLAIIIACTFALGLLLTRTARGSARQTPLLLARQATTISLFVLSMIALGYIAQARDIDAEGIDRGFEEIQISRRDLANAESGYLPEADVSTLSKALQFLPQGFACFLAMPLPWQTGSIRQNMAIPDTFLWLLLYPLLMVGVGAALRKNMQACVLILAASLAMCCFYSIFLGNIGSVYRMRTQVWLLWASFLGPAIDALRQPPAVRRPTTRHRQRETVLSQ